MISEIILIRHGRTVGNENKWFYGATDLSLSEDGRRGIRERKEKGFYPPLPASVQVFTTGLCRTDETLALIYGEMPHAEIPELQEMNFGEYECHAFSELKDDPVFLEWGYDETLNFRLPGAETQREFRDRVTLGLEKLVAAHRQQEEVCRAVGEPAAVTLMICHGGVISEMMNQLFPGAKKTMWDWMPEPGYGYELFCVDGRPARAVPLGESHDPLSADVIGFLDEEKMETKTGEEAGRDAQ